VTYGPPVIDRHAPLLQHGVTENCLRVTEDYHYLGELRLPREGVSGAMSLTQLFAVLRVLKAVLRDSVLKKRSAIKRHSALPTKGASSERRGRNVTPRGAYGYVMVRLARHMSMSVWPTATP